MNPGLLGTLYLLLYFAIAATTALVCHYLFPIPKELFRKILHFILLGSFLVFIFAYPTWQSAALAAIIFEVLVYPILAFFERYKGYSELTTERKHGELKASLMLVFTMFAIVVSICWGIFDDKYLALASLYAWGIGDAFAALIGKQFGKHKINPGCGTCCRRYRTLFQKRQRHHHLSVICHGCLITTGLLIWRFII